LDDDSAFGQRVDLIGHAALLFPRVLHDRRAYKS
tara:strand:+ start:27595 stop:27696 length:102 start_codon:yes stop_codon:yes gene_type:complete